MEGWFLPAANRAGRGGAAYQRKYETEVERLPCAVRERRTLVFGADKEECAVRPVHPLPEGTEGEECHVPGHGGGVELRLVSRREGGTEGTLPRKQTIVLLSIQDKLDNLL